MLRALYDGGLDTAQIILSLFAYLMILFLIQPLHECAHAWMARKMGDDTALNAGRLTLNPFKHLDMTGTVAMLLIGFGWGKPVPVNSRNFKDPRKGIGLTSLAGPVSNFIAAFIGMIGFKLASGAYYTDGDVKFYYLLYFFVMFTRLNVVLAVFNLIPVPPLDGSGVFLWIMPRKVSEKYVEFSRRYSMFLPMLLFALMFTPVMSWVQEGVVWLLDKMTFFISMTGGKA